MEALDLIIIWTNNARIRARDSGRSTASVQSSLVMYPIWKYGSEEQKQISPEVGLGEM